MSRPRFYWYGAVKSLIMNDKTQKDGSEMADKLRKAIDEAMDEVSELPNGQERVHALNAVLFEKVLTMEGAARELHYGKRTIESWVSSFVIAVGKKIGY